MRLSFPNILFTPTPRPTDCNIKWEIKKSLAVVVGLIFLVCWGNIYVEKEKEEGTVTAAVAPNWSRTSSSSSSAATY